MRGPNTLAASRVNLTSVHQNTTTMEPIDCFLTGGTSIMSFSLVAYALQYLSPELIGKIAKAAGLERVIAEKAIGAMIPGVIGRMAAAAATQQGAARITGLIGASLDLG